MINVFFNPEWGYSKSYKIGRNEGIGPAMKAVNEEKKLTRTAPSEKAVQGWVDQVKQFDPMISH